MISKKGFIDFIDKKDIAVTATSFAIGIAAANFLNKIIDSLLNPIQRKLRRNNITKYKKLFDVVESFVVLMFTLFISYVLFTLTKKYLKIT